MWKAVGDISGRNNASQGLAREVAAGRVCQQLEKIAQTKVQAISLKDGTLTIKVNHAQILAWKLEEGLVLKELLAYCNLYSLPKVEQIRLTISEV